MKRHSLRVIGTSAMVVAAAKNERRCDRCGRVRKVNTTSGLSLCKDCKHDKWYINKITEEAL